MPPSSSAVAAITPIKVPASSCQPPVSWLHRSPSWLLPVFTGLPDTGLPDTGLLECLQLEELVTAPQGCQQPEPLAMEPQVEAQTSMVVSIGLVAVNHSFSGASAGSASAPWALLVCSVTLWRQPDRGLLAKTCMHL